MWGDAGLNAGSVTVLSQMGLMDPGLCVSRCKCLLAMVHNARYGSVELQAASLWGSNVNPQNAEKMLIVAGSKNISVEHVPRYHKWRLCSST